MYRRDFLQTAACGLTASLCLGAAAPSRRILLRSSWQVVNIGDIAHTPGVLSLLEKHIPEADVALWASKDLSEPVAAMLRHRFPKIRVVKGTLGATGASTPELQAEIDHCDFLLHGSGPSFVAATDVAAFVSHTGKPFGVYGITYGGASESQRNLLSQAQFLYFRETVSLAKAQDDGIQAPIMEFGPDGAFACDVLNPEAAAAFLKQQGLQVGKFVCCIPRLRYTPYWLVKQGTQFNAEKHARNEEMREHDHAPLREAIIRLVAETDHKVLLCPEDMTQMQVGKDNILDRLPEKVRDRVVWRDQYWLTDEALAVYRQSAGMFGLEMHSPIMCIGNGIPAIVCRFAEQTSKGFMWRDIGLNDWLFDADDPQQMEKYIPAVLEMVTNRAAATDRVQQAQRVVRERFTTSMNQLRASLKLA